MREAFKDKKRIVFKVGSSTITHEETGGLDLVKLEKFVRILTDLHNQGKDIIVVSSGAIAARTKWHLDLQAARYDKFETGLCGDRAEPSDDRIPEIIFRIQSVYGTDSYDKIYY